MNIRIPKKVQRRIITIRKEIITKLGEDMLIYSFHVRFESIKERLKIPVLNFVKETLLALSTEKNWNRTSPES